MEKMTTKPLISLERGAASGKRRTSQKGFIPQKPQNIMGLVAVLLLGVGSVFILFSVFAVCYRLARSCIRVSKFDVIVPQSKLGVLNVDLLFV